jgi:Fervidolysin N-terminal prodomain
MPGLMKSIALTLTLCLSLGACGSRNVAPGDDAGVAVPERTGQESYVADQLIVRIDSNRTEAAARELLSGQGATLLRAFQTPNLYLVGLPDGSDVNAWKRRLEALPGVVQAQPNYTRRP